MIVNKVVLVPYRRHLRPAALEAELKAAGFRVVFCDERHSGSLACVVAQRGAIAERSKSS